MLSLRQACPPAPLVFGANPAVSLLRPRKGLGMRRLTVTAASFFWILLVLPILQTASYERDRSFSLVNSSNRTVKEVYVRRIKSDSFGRDLLGKRLIPPGSSIELKLVRHQGYCRFDLKFAFDDDTWQTLWDINLCEAATVTASGQRDLTLSVEVAEAPQPDEIAAMGAGSGSGRPAGGGGTGGGGGAGWGGARPSAGSGAAGGPVISADQGGVAVGRPVVESEIKRMEEAGKALDTLPRGKIVLDAPTTMKVTEVRTVYANVGINVPDELLRKHSLPGGQSTEDPIRVSREMLATLTGPGFKIVATTPEQQNIAEGYPAVWSWNIEATQEGEQQLEATLYALVPMPTGDKPSQWRINSYTHTIGVTVKQQTWGEWLNSVLKSTQEEFEALKAMAVTVGSATTLLIGWMGWAYGRRRRERSKASSTTALRLFARPSGQTRATQTTTQRARKAKKLAAESVA